MNTIVNFNLCWLYTLLHNNISDGFSISTRLLFLHIDIPVIMRKAVKGFPFMCHQWAGRGLYFPAAGSIIATVKVGHSELSEQTDIFCHPARVGRLTLSKGVG